MALYANMRDYRFADNVDDIRGSDIHGADNEKLGTIDDVIFDNTTGDVRYLVIDTGGWLRSKKFVVPARQVMTAVEGEERGYRVALRRDQIERFPEYREEVIDRDEDWNDYERRYKDSYRLTETGDVLHQPGSTHTITPDPNEMPAASGRSDVAGRDLTPRRVAQDMPRFGATSDSEDVAHTGELGGGDMRPLQPSSTLRPGDKSKSVGIGGGVESNEEIRRAAERREREGVGGSESEPVTFSRDEFTKEGTLRSEYDAPREDRFVDRETRPTADSVASDADISGYAPDGGQRFRSFQERLRREREEILRRRNERKIA
jgi:sporulation protein YlmC with PRC-barrel domain